MEITMKSLLHSSMISLIDNVSLFPILFHVLLSAVQPDSEFTYNLRIVHRALLVSLLHREREFY